MRSTFYLAAAMAAMVVAGAAFAQDPHQAEEGQQIFKRTCMLCHTNEAGKNKIGPSLFGVVGRKSGTLQGYQYSAAMKGANITWSNDTLDKYLADPKTDVPGNKMIYPGVKKAEDRKDLIAYIETLH